MSVQGSAAAQAPSSAPSGSSEGHGAEGGQGSPDAFDYKAAFKSTQKALSDTKTQFDSFRKEIDPRVKEFSENSELLSKLKGVFSPEKDSAPDPVQNWNQQLDFYIEQAIEAEKRGQAMPLTTNLAISHYKSLIENHQRETKLMETVNKLQSQMEQMRDPGHAINTQAYSTLDNNIKRGLDSLFGPGDDSLPQKRSLFNAVGQQVAAAIQEIQQKSPQRWDMMRRDSAALAELANKALRMNIPPKAIQMLEEEQLKNTAMSMGELRQAMKEAEGIEDPQERQRIREKIRQQILENMYSSGKIRVAK